MLTTCGRPQGGGVSLILTWERGPKPWFPCGRLSWMTPYHIY